jgi:methionyl-tRNA formyltransferase
MPRNARAALRRIQETAQLAAIHAENDVTNLTRVVFMGTPDYAVPALRMLHEHPEVHLALVVTQPDRPQGRGRKLQSPPVRLAADELGVPVLQEATLRDPDTRARLESAQPDLIVVAAFGIILGPKTLNLPRLGCVNLHASLLPKFRGANPIASAIAMGESETGVTLMQMDRGLDTGPILAMSSVRIAGDDTTATLTDRLAVLGAELLAENLEQLIKGTIEPTIQPPDATLTRPMTKDDGWIDWQSSAQSIVDHVRAMIPWPKSWTTLPDGSRLQVLEARVTEQEEDNDITGRLVIGKASMEVTTGSGSIEIRTAQLPGGKPIETHALADRLRAFDGDILGTVGPTANRTPLVVTA